MITIICQGAVRAKGNVYGKEINDETYTICKSDMMIKGNDPANIKSGPTLATDEFLGTRYDFMLSNPPYGKNWATDAQYIKDGKVVIDNRFRVRLRDSESVPLKDSIHSYFQREVHPHVPEAWIDIDSVKIGYEISFNKYFYRHQPLGSVEVVAAEILELERQSEGLIAQILDMKND